MSRQHRGVAVTLLVVPLGLVSATLPVFLLGALAPAIQSDLGTTQGELGGAVAAFFVAAAISSVPAGRYADRFGSSVSLRTGLSIALVASGAMAWWVGSSIQLSLAMFVGGAAIGFVDTGGARALAGSVPVRRQGLAFGIKEASIPTASFLAGVSVPILGASLGWRSGFTVGAALALLIAVVASPRLGAAWHRSEGSPRDARGRGETDREEPAVRVVPAPERTGGSVPLVLLALTAAFAGGAAAASTAFLVLSGVAGGLTPAAAGALLAAASSVAIVTRLAVGLAADRRAGDAVTIVTTMLVIGAIGAGCLAVASRAAGTGASPLFAAWVVGAVLVIGLGWGWTGLVFLSAIRLDPTRPAKAAGVVLAGLGVGGAAGPASFGATAGQVGWAAAWSLAAAALALGAALAFAAQRLKDRPRSHGCR